MATQFSTEKFPAKNKGRNTDPDTIVGNGVSIGINSSHDEYPEVMEENRDELYETHSSDSDSDNSLSGPSDSSDGEIPDEEPPEEPPHENRASQEPSQITEMEDETELTEKEVIELRQDPKVKKLLKAFWLEAVGSHTGQPMDRTKRVDNSGQGSTETGNSNKAPVNKKVNSNVKSKMSKCVVKQKDKIKSPSDTTIYAPALNKSPVGVGHVGLVNLRQNQVIQLPCVNPVETPSTAAIDQISNFVEQLQFETTQRASDHGGDGTDSRRRN